jgi:hypothetical protein
MSNHRNWTGSALSGRAPQSGFRSIYRMAEKTEVGTMKEAQDRRSTMWQRILAAAIAAALLSTLIPGIARPYNQDRMDKDISIMENVINTAMMESEYVYIFSMQNNVRGLYIPEFGALFTVQVQLISDLATPFFSNWLYTYGAEGASPLWMVHRMDKEKLEKLFEKLDITVNGKKVNLDEYFLTPEDLDEEGEEGTDREDFLVRRKRLEHQRQQKREELAKKNLEQYKEELAGLVADYGGTIRQLSDDQWVMVVAYLDASRATRWEEEPAKIIVKAKKADIDLYDSGKIDYDELRARMDIDTR